MGLFDLFRSKKKRNAGQVVDAAGMGMPSMFDVKALQMGTQRSAVIPLTCGACAERWDDAVEPMRPMELPCPHCGATNRVTLRLTIYTVG